MDHDLGVIGVGKWHVYSNSQRLSGVGNFFFCSYMAVGLVSAIGVVAFCVVFLRLIKNL